MTAPLPDQALSAAGKAAAAARRADQLKRKADALASMPPALAGMTVAAGRGGWEAELRRKLTLQERALLAALAKVVTLSLAVGQTLREASEREGAEYVAGIAQAAGWSPDSAMACRAAAQLHQAQARRAWKLANRGRSLSPFEIFEQSTDPAAALRALLELVVSEPGAAAAQMVRELDL